MDTNDTQHTTNSRHPGAERAAEALVDSLIEIGTVWARHGLGVGRSALQASARTLERTAEALGELARVLERTAAANDQGSRASANVTPEDATAHAPSEPANASAPADDRGAEEPPSTR